MRAPPVRLSPAAAARLRATTIDGQVFRLSVRPRGCAGASYDLRAVAAPEPHDLVIEQDGARLCVDPKAELFIIGTEMDYQSSTLSEGFVFKNPNETGRCGCGESFMVG